MKKNMFITASILLLMSVVLASGCAQNSKVSGTDYYEADLYKMVSKTEHDKKFPKGHPTATGKDENKHCYYNEGTTAYFCQYWDDWDE